MWLSINLTEHSSHRVVNVRAGSVALWNWNMQQASRSQRVQGLLKGVPPNEHKNQHSCTATNANNNGSNNKSLYRNPKSSSFCYLDQGMMTSNKPCRKASRPNRKIQCRRVHERAAMLCGIICGPNKAQISSVGLSEASDILRL